MDVLKALEFTPELQSTKDRVQNELVKKICKDIQKQLLKFIIYLSKHRIKS